MALTPSTNAVVVAQAANCYLVKNTQQDYRNDSNPALRSQLFLHIEPGGAGQSGDVTLDVLSSSVSSVVSGTTATLTVSQGGTGMAASGGTTILATFTNCYLETNTQQDFRNDTNPAKMSLVFVYIEPMGGGGQGGRLTFTVPTTALAGVTSGAVCTLTISQG